MINFSELTKNLPSYRWKIQSFNQEKTKGLCVPYFDARDLENRLDSVLTPFLWQDKYYQVKETLFCALGIKDGDEWLWKWGAGVEKKSYDDSDDIKLKGEASDAFKLAGVKWGIFRDVYSKKSVWVAVKNKKPVDEYGKRIWDLTKYINSMSEKPENQRREEKKEAYSSKKTTSATSAKDLSLALKDCRDLTKKYSKYISESYALLLEERFSEAKEVSILKWTVKLFDALDILVKITPYIPKEQKTIYYKQVFEGSIPELDDLKDSLETIGSAYFR